MRVLRRRQGRLLIVLRRLMLEVILARWVSLRENSIVEAAMATGGSLSISFLHSRAFSPKCQSAHDRTSPTIVRTTLRPFCHI
jgi:hypothetical protein